ncbi:MAG: twin-arginine translocation signal domain-containing protein [Verrucomicrobiia bacterium]
MNYLSTRRDFIKGVIGSALVVLTSPAATTPPNSNPAKKI